MNDLIDRSDDPQLGRSLGLSRRQLLAATTGMAAAAALGAAAFGGGPAHAATRAAVPGAVKAAGNGVLLPPGKRGIILYTVRDAISRDPNTTDLASGFKEVFQELSRIGYKQIEFAGYGQHANAEGGNVNNVAGAQQLRAWLDDNGLEAEGNHGSIPGVDQRRDHRRVRRRSARSRTSSASATSARATTRPAAPSSPTGSSPPTGGTSSASAPRRTG